MSLGNLNLRERRDPKVTRLPEGRLRVERWFNVENRRFAWADKLLTKLFIGFGRADGYQPADDKTLQTGEAYTDCKLIEEVLDEDIDQRGKRSQFIYQVYVTLGATFAREDADKVRMLKNGLRVLDRAEVAEPGVALPYDEDDVGEYVQVGYDALSAAFTVGLVVTGGTSGKTGTVVRILPDGTSGVLVLSGVIGVFTDDEAITDSGTGAAVVDGKTLYLASVEDDSNDRRARMLTSWAEPGILNRSERALQDGSKQRTTTYLAVEGTATGPVTAKEEGDYSGLKTVVVTERLNKSGGSVTSGVINTYTTKVDFTYPGTIDVDSNNLDANLVNYQVATTSPISRPVPMTIKVEYQTANELTTAEQNSIYDPVSWATTYIYGIGRNYRAFASTKTWNGYKAVANASVSVTQPVSPSEGVNLIQGMLLFAGYEGGITVGGSTAYPTGSTVLDIDLKPDFVDVDGTQYYKKITATATLA